MAYSVKIFDSADDIGKDRWGQIEDSDNPFQKFAFYKALEKGGCTTESTGMRPLYVTLEDKEGLAMLFCVYEKYHSYGEYIFDWQWAQAYKELGISYYPKLLLMTPFFSVTSSKLLKRSGFDITQMEFYALLKQLSQQLDLSSFHYLFLPEEEFQKTPEFVIKRESLQFHFINRDYLSFEHFLLSLKKNRRKNIKKERKKVQQSGVEIQWIRGEFLADYSSFFYTCYIQTIHKKKAMAYLSEAFFESLFQELNENLLLVVAKLDGRPIACSLFFIGKNRLFGRYWGCLQEIPFLHFELCYYQGIEFCIQHNLDHFEAGAQGEHKLLRGFDPKWVYSVHWMRDPKLHQAVKTFCQQEKNYLVQTIAEYENYRAFDLSKS